jgi:hypothetical protein
MKEIMGNVDYLTSFGGKRIRLEVRTFLEEKLDVSIVHLQRFILSKAKWSLRL